MKKHEKKYIEVEGIMRACYDSFLKTGNKAYSEIIALADAVPAADVQEVKHGHWEKVDDNPYEYVAACSVCRNEVKQPTCMLKPIYSYCPICGARMVNEDE